MNRQQDEYTLIENFICTEDEDVEGYDGTDVVVAKRNSIAFGSSDPIEFYLFGCTYDGVDMELPVGKLPQTDCPGDKSACGPESFNDGNSFPEATGTMYNPGSKHFTLTCPDGATMVIRTRMNLPNLQFRNGMSFLSTVPLELHAGTCQLIDYENSPTWPGEEGDFIEILISPKPFDENTDPKFSFGGTSNAVPRSEFCGILWLHAAFFLFWWGKKW